MDSCVLRKFARSGIVPVFLTLSFDLADSLGYPSPGVVGALVKASENRKPVKNQLKGVDVRAGTRP